MADIWYQGLQAFNVALIINVVRTTREFANLSMPVVGISVLVIGVGYIVGGIRVRPNKS